MSISVGDILRVVATVAWTDGNLQQNVFNAVITGSGGPFTDGDIADDAEAWVANMFANLVSNMSDECDGSSVAVYKYDAIDDDWDEVATVGWTFNPTGTIEQLPRGVAALILGRTTDPDVYGKKYLGGLIEANLTDGLCSSAFLITMLAVAADWITPFVGGTSGASWTPGVWSVVKGSLLPFVTSYTANAIPAYQRRRKRGVGI